MQHQTLRTHFSRYVPLAFAVMLLLPAVAFSQTDAGSITGTVKDQDGAIVSGATVTIKNQKTGAERIATTGDDGTFSIPALKASAYTVTATATGLSGTVKDVEINVGRETNLNIPMKLGDLTASINIVAGEEVAIATGSASMGTNVNPREVEGLPNNGRQLSQFYLQAPGSVNSGSGTFSDIRFSGRAVQQNVIRYDGIEGTAIIDASPGNLNGEIPTPFRLQSSLENVQEFRVESNNFTAEFGTGTGGQINVVTKSGGNSFHGSVFEYLRNDRLDAANFFDNIIGQKTPLRLNQFGGSIGGPIKGNRAFFFFSYEGYRLRAGVNAIEAVPGEQARICAPAPNGVPCVAATAAMLPAFRSPNAVIIQRGTGANLFDVAQLQANTRVDENSAAARFDFKLNPKHSMYFRFFRDQGKNIQPEGVTGRVVNIVANPQNGVVALQSSLAPNLFNEVKVGFNGAYTRINGVAPTVAGIDLSVIAINISGNTANFGIAGQGTSAGTAVPGGLVRANSATNGRGQPYTPYSLSLVDTLNWTRGNHNVKAGGELRLIRLYTDRQGGTTYTYSNLTTFLSNTLTSVQFLGDVSAASPFNGGATGLRYAKQEYYVGYLLDEWKVTPNLTLNYGLRYEYYTALHEDRNLQVLFNIDNGTFRDPSEKAFQTSKTNFGPRVALTWSPSPNSTGFFGGGKTVLRGGFGIFYGPGQTEDQIQPIESDRISATFTSGALNVFPLDPAAATTFFNANPNTRSYQPRAYALEYNVPEKVYQYTVSFQQELPYKMVLTGAYVGSQGRNLFLRSVANRILPGQVTIADGTALPNGVGVINRTNAAGRVIAVNTVREFAIVSGTSTVQNPFAEVDYKTSGGHDSYNALQMSLGRRFSTGLTLNAQYTFGKSFGNTAGSNEARTSANNARALSEYEYDNSYNNFDVRHTFNLSAIYDLPIGSGRTYDLGSVGNALLSNWEIGLIANARSGLPIEVGITRADVVIQCTNAAAGCTSGEVRALPGTINAATPLPAGFTAVVNTPGGGASRNVRRPNLIPGISPYLNNDRNLLNPAAFAIPAPGTFGNLSRNALRGPNFRQFDLILNKRFHIREHMNVEFRTEIFNIFNHPNFANPAGTLNNAIGTTVNGQLFQPGQPFTQAAAGSTFGLLRSTVERTVGLGTSRQIQFALRLNF